MHYFNNKAHCLLFSLLLILSVPFAYADEHESKVSGEFEFFFHNKFVEEGINEIPGRAIVKPELEIEFEGIHIGDFEVPSFFIEAELAIAESEDLRESELSIGKEWEWDNFSMVLGYTWKYEDEEEEENGEEEEEEEPNDHEFFLGLSCEECLPFEIVPDLTYTYSAEADGGMIEIDLAKEIEMDHFSIEPYVGALIDFGYVTEEYNGLNNILVGLAVNIPLNDTISLGMYATHSFAEENLRREDFDDQTWGGIGLEFDI